MIYDALLAYGKVTNLEKDLLRLMRPVWRIYLFECRSDVYPVYPGLLPVPAIVNATIQTPFNAFVFKIGNELYAHPKLVEKFNDTDVTVKSKKGCRRRAAQVVQGVLNRRAANPIICSNVFEVLGEVPDDVGGDDAPGPIMVLPLLI